MAKAVKSSDGQSFNLSIVDRQDFGNKATVDALIAFMAEFAKENS